MKEFHNRKQLLALLLATWEQYPELRLCQLLSNAALDNGWKDFDLYYLTDKKLFEYLTKYLVKESKQ